MSTIKVPSLSNKLVEVAVIAAVLVVFLIAMQLAYGQTLDDLVGETLQQQSYRAELMDFINRSYYDDDQYAMLTLLPKEQITEKRVGDVLILPTLSLESLEELAKRIISVNNSQIFLQKAITKVKEQQEQEEAEKIRQETAELDIQREEGEKKNKFYDCLENVPGGITSNNQTAINECANLSGLPISFIS